MVKQMVLSVMSKDRPGIVADITGAIFALDGDLADLRQSVLCGYFTMILVVNFHEEITPEDVIARFSHIHSDTKVEVVIKEIDPPASEFPAEPGTETYILTAQGKNRGGLVYAVGKFCYDHRINILDLSTTLVDDLYTMVLQIDLNKAGSVNTIRQDLSQFSQDTGLSVTMQHNDIFQATNEIRLI